MNGKPWTPEEDGILRRCIADMPYEDLGAKLGRSPQGVKLHAHRLGLCRVKVLPIPERFWANVEMSSECWTWLGMKDETGYGYITIQAKHIPARRFSYELANGPIPERAIILDRCGNIGCVNPAHLLIGTRKDKTQAMIRQGRFGDACLPLKERIMKRIKVSEQDCWEWQAKRAGMGYGQIGLNGSRLYVHRAMWELTNGAIPDGLFVLHHCDNPPCCNPDHLFLGTPKDNTQDMVRKGRNRGQFTRREA